MVPGDLVGLLCRLLAQCLQKPPTAEPGTLLKPADRTRPPGRVRHAFKQMDLNRSGGLTLEELKAGMAKELGVEELAPHVFQAMEYQFLAHADDREDGVKVLTAKVFSRYYCEVLFRHFDKNNNGVLELAEVHEALKFLVKPDADGNQVMPVIVFPSEYCRLDGEVKLPISWFWECTRVRHRTRSLHFRAPCACHALQRARLTAHAPYGRCVDVCAVPVAAPQGLLFDGMRQPRSRQIHHLEVFWFDTEVTLRV